MASGDASSISFQVPALASVLAGASAGKFWLRSLRDLLQASSIVATAAVKNILFIKTMFFIGKNVDSQAAGDT
jgi:hypothetical protein